MNRLTPIILKLGGSAITFKDKPFKPNVSTIKRLAREISKANLESLIVVHGGGSFGHPIAKEYKIVDGYKSSDQLIGFSKTRQAMMVLNKLILDAFIEYSLVPVSVQPSAFIITEKSRIKNFNPEIIKKILNLHMLPILYGDAVLDRKLGFTILSGDQIISKLAITLEAKKIIVCVDVDGLYDDDPKLNKKAKFVKEITLSELNEFLEKIGNSKVIDVTGGMYGKIVELIPAVERGALVKIINAKKVNRLYRALRNEEVISTEIR